MNLDYSSLFDEAMNRSVSMVWPELNARLVIDPNVKLDHERIRRTIAHDLSDGVASNTWALAGRCFLVARELSYVMSDLRIPHAVTIGNVLVKDEPYFTTTLDSLIAERRQGYVGDTPANAHCWLTLLDGSVLDASLNSSIAHRNGQTEAPSFYEAVHIGQQAASQCLTYIPMFTGLHYHFEVVTHEWKDRHFETYAAWVDHYDAATKSSWWSSASTGRGRTA